MLTLDEQIKEVRKALKKQKHEILKFEPEAWEHLTLTHNCLTYALNLKYAYIEDYYFRNLGMLLGTPITKCLSSLSVEELYNLSFKTVEACGLEVKESYFNEYIPPKYYKLAICIFEHDIHWLRQDDDGTWSHKFGWYLPPSNVDENGSIILNPDTANFQYNDSIQGKLLCIKYIIASRFIKYNFRALFLRK